MYCVDVNPEEANSFSENLVENKLLWKIQDKFQLGLFWWCKIILKYLKKYTDIYKHWMKYVKSGTAYPPLSCSQTWVLRQWQSKAKGLQTPEDICKKSLNTVKTNWKICLNRSLNTKKAIIILSFNFRKENFIQIPLL